MPLSVRRTGREANSANAFDGKIALVAEAISLTVTPAYHGESLVPSLS
ncbi:hypothetical protein POL68_24740 [Stigmatella sp. ncwal1]|uniref:Transposase n=1 Tax=Stigmatella ashevillensis TaxID=2995309 RepID=A0ABT5DF40_9BACT|nr:hypothetical protein [Stigmatella ashevillena]MDC0711699.1 hypothetical protein [Stigmatella ashevillena]